MKFNLILINSPYQGEKNGKQKSAPQIYPKFILKSLDMLIDNGYLASINPIHWRSSNNKQFKTLQNKLFYYDILYLNTNLIPFANVAITVDYFILKKSNTENFVTKLGTGANINIKKYKNSLSNLTLELNGGDTIVTKYIKEKLSYDNGYRKGVSYPEFGRTNKKTKKNIYPHKAGTYLNDDRCMWYKNKHVDQNNKKILISSIRALRPMFDYGKYGAGPDCHYILVDKYSDKEINSLLSFLNSNIFKYIHKKMSATGEYNNFRNDLSYLSNLDIKNIDNIKLTQEEIDLIESTIK